MNKIFEEFMKRVNEEQRARQERASGGFSQFSRSSSRQQGRGPQEDRYSYSRADTWDQEEPESPRREKGGQSFNEQFERAKRAEAEQRYEEYMRMERESEEAEARRKKKMEEVVNKAYDSIVKGKTEAEKSGLISGVITGLKEFFKK